MADADELRRCACGAVALDGHLTCGRVSCDEAGARALDHFVRRGQAAQSAVNELVTVTELGNAQLAMRLGSSIGEFFSRFPAATTDGPLYARLIELAAAADAFTRELAAAAAARRS